MSQTLDDFLNDNPHSQTNGKQNIDTLKGSDLFNKESFGNNLKSEILMSDRDIDMHDTTANFVFDVTANFGQGSSQMENYQGDNKLIEEIDRDGRLHMPKPKSFDDHLQEKFAEVGSLDFINNQEFSLVKKPENDGLFDSEQAERERLREESKVIALRNGSFFGTQDEPMDPFQSKFEKHSDVEFGGSNDFITKTTSDHETKALKNAEKNYFKENALKSPASNGNLTEHQTRLPMFGIESGNPIGNSSGPSFGQNLSEVQKRQDDVHYDSFGKEPPTKISHFHMNNTSDSQIFNDVSFNNDYFNTQQRLLSKPEPHQNFQKTSLRDQDFITSELSLQNKVGVFQPLDSPNLSGQRLPKLESVSIKNTATFANTKTDTKVNDRNKSSEIDSMELARLIEKRMKMKKNEQRSDLRKLNTTYRKLEMEEQTLKANLEKLTVLEKKILELGGSSLSETPVEVREKKKKFERLVNRLENEKAAVFSGKVEMSPSYSIQLKDMKKSSLYSMIYLKQERMLDKVQSISEQEKRTFGEIESGNLYDLMNEIELKLHHYDFKSENFEEMNRLYLQRLQLERELYELKKKEIEYALDDN